MNTPVNPLSKLWQHGAIGFVAAVVCGILLVASQVIARWIDASDLGSPHIKAFHQTDWSRSVVTDAATAGYLSLWLVSSLAFIITSIGGILIPVLHMILKDLPHQRMSIWSVRALVSLFGFVALAYFIPDCVEVFGGTSRFIYFDSVLAPHMSIGSPARWWQALTDMAGTASLTMGYGVGVEYIARYDTWDQGASLNRLDRLTKTASVIMILGIVEVNALYSWATSSLFRLSGGVVMVKPDQGFPVFVRCVTLSAGAAFSLLLIGAYAYGAWRITGSFGWTSRSEERKGMALATLAPLGTGLVVALLK
jgi:hypothetical protein